MVAHSTRTWISIVAVLLLSSSWLLSGGALAQAPRTIETPQAASCANPTVTITSAVISDLTVTIYGGILTGGPASNCAILSNETNWGDGVVTGGFGAAAFPGTHTYFGPGAYTINVYVNTTNLTTGAAGHGIASYPVSVHGAPYSVQLGFDQPFHLPGDSARLFISVINTTTTAPQSGVGSFYITSCYFTNTNPGTCAKVNSLITPAGSNLTSIPFTVPPNAEAFSTLLVTVEVNATLPTGAHSENGTATLSIASPSGVNLCASPTSSSGPCASSFTPGVSFILTATGTLDTTMGGEPWANATACAVFYLNNLQVLGSSSTNGCFPATLTANSLGVVSLVVPTSQIRNSAGQTTGDLNITVHYSDNLASYTLALTSTIFVHITPVPSVQVVVTLGYSAYYGGDTLTGNYQLTTYTGAAPQGWTANRYFVLGFPGSPSCGGNDVQVLAYGTGISGSRGSIPSFVIPVGLQGSIDVGVYANNATQSAEGDVCDLVSQPALLVQPSETTYNPGDTISVSLTPQGSVFNGASYFAEVSGTTGSGVIVLYNSTLGASTSFSFNIPRTGALTAYTLTAVAQTSTAGIISGQDIPLTEHAGYSLQVSIQTKSAYSDGSFQPGQSVTFGYTVTSWGTASPPKTFTLTAAYANSAQGSTSAIESSATGTITVTIPASSGNGVDLLFFTAQIPTPSGTLGYGTTVGLLVESSPTPLDYEVFGAGTSFNVTELLVIVILVVAALIVGLMWRRRRRGASGIQVEKKHRWGKKKNQDQGVSPWPQQPSQDPQAPTQGDPSQVPPMQPYDAPPTDQHTPGLPGDQAYNYPPQ